MRSVLALAVAQAGSCSWDSTPSLWNFHMPRVQPAKALTLDWALGFHWIKGCHGVVSNTGPGLLGWTPYDQAGGLSIWHWAGLGGTQQGLWSVNLWQARCMVIPDAATSM